MSLPPPRRRLCSALQVNGHSGLLYTRQCWISRHTLPNILVFQRSIPPANLPVGYPLAPIFTLAATPRNSGISVAAIQPWYISAKLPQNGSRMNPSRLSSLHIPVAFLSCPPSPPLRTRQSHLHPTSSMFNYPSYPLYMRLQFHPPRPTVFRFGVSFHQFIHLCHVQHGHILRFFPSSIPQTTKRS